MKAQLGNVATGTIKVTKRQNITVRTGSGKESVLAYYCKFPLHTKDVNGRQYIFHIPVWVVQFLHSEFFLGSNFIMKSGVFLALRPNSLEMNENTQFPIIWNPTPSAIKLLL